MDDISGQRMEAKEGFQADIDNNRMKITDIYLEEDTLTLWRPSHDTHQYKLIPMKLPTGDLTPILQTYYTKFNCITSTLTFDDAVPIIEQQQTTLKPTDDYTILRDYPLIQGLWFKPDFEERLSPEEETTVGNMKLSISLPSSEKESIFKQMNVYFLEVVDYPAEDKSVSRLLLTKSKHEKFENYDIEKPGGPIQVIYKVAPLQGEVEIHFLRMSNNYRGIRWRHEVEFMLEEDPWPLCKIIPVNNRSIRRPAMTVSRDIGLNIPLRYVGASWRETLAGLFVWALRSRLVWLVFERLHCQAKEAFEIAIRHVEIRDVILTECPLVCPEMFDTYAQLASFIEKCETENELKEIYNIFMALHRCDEDCTLVSLKTLDSCKVLHGVLFLLEKLIGCASTQFRHEVTSTILPWSVMGYYCSDLKITSHRKMVLFISRTEGINTDLYMRPLSPMFLCSGMSSGYCSARTTPRILISSPIKGLRDDTSDDDDSYEDSYLKY